MELRLGTLLVQNGVLTTVQVDEILERQAVTAEPFGVLAESMFGVDPAAVEMAWARQYAGLTRRVDPADESVCARALAAVTRRQAWQFRILPVRFEPTELVLATTEMHLPRALRFVTNVLGVPAVLVMADAEALGRALCLHYPLPGMTPRSVLDDGLDRIMARVA